MSMLIEAVDVQTRSLVQAQASRRIDFGAPLRLPRPTDGNDDTRAAPGDRMATASELHAFFGR